MEDNQRKVLIVDDEEDITWTITRKLSKDNDKFEVLGVNSGKDALELLDKYSIDIVVTDVRMPEVSGLDLLYKIKEKYPSTKVVIMTAYGSSDVQAEANSRGCFQYIEKPFEINDLRDIILEGLEQKTGFNGNVSDFQLSDLIQLNCLGRLTISLVVKHGNEEGTIYFRDGNIVHAEKDELTGEAAFYHIMNWHNGEFSAKRSVSIPKETIFNSWQSLLLESMRRADENSELVRKDKENEKYWRSLKLESVLDKLKKTEGVQHLLLNHRNGEFIFYTGDFGKQKERITDFSNDVFLLLKNFEIGKKILNNQPLEFLEIQLENQIIFLSKIPYQEAFLTIVGSKKVNSGFVRLEIKKTLFQIAQLI